VEARAEEQVEPRAQTEAPHSPAMPRRVARSALPRLALARSALPRLALALPLPRVKPQAVETPEWSTPTLQRPGLRLPTSRCVWLSFSRRHLDRFPNARRVYVAFHQRELTNRGQCDHRRP